MTGSVARQLVDAVAARDVDRMVALLDPAVDFKGLTPGRLWEAAHPDGVVEAYLGNWFGESDRIDAVTAFEEGDPVEDTRRVGYRFHVTNHDGAHVVEQQVYYRERDGRIAYARVLCSGYRPLAE
jgi:hypothetical protein